MKSIRANKLIKQLIVENSLLIDVRTSIEYSRFHIPKSYNIPSELLLKSVSKYLNKDYVYFIICADGSRSKDVCKKLNKLKFQVYNVKGGINNYKGKLVTTEQS